MLGMVTPQVVCFTTSNYYPFSHDLEIFIPYILFFFVWVFVYFQLQMPNLRQVSGQTPQPPVDEGQLGQPAALQTLSALPPHSQIKLQSGLIPNIQEAQVSAIRHNSLVPNQLTAHPKPPLQPRMPLPQHSSNPVAQLGTLPGHSSLTLPSVRPQSLGSLHVRPPHQLAISPPMNQQTHASLLQHSGQLGGPSVGTNIRMVRPDASFQVPSFVIFFLLFFFWETG